MTHNRVEIHPDIMFGKPVIKGTHITDWALKIPRLRALLEEAAERLPGTFVVHEVRKTRFRPLS
jgi:hypothetical protein